MTQFVGSRPVKYIDGTTVHFEDGGKTEYTEASLAYTLSEEPRDDSDVQMSTVDAVAEDILQVFEKHDVRFFDVNLIMAKVKWSCDNYNDRAMSKVAGLLDEYDGITDKQIRNIRVSHLKKYLNS